MEKKVNAAAEAKKIKYPPLSADPTSPEEGTVFNSDGTSRAAGMWVYLNGGWKPLKTK